MTALPIEGYAKDYTDAAQLVADIAARKRRLAAFVQAEPAPEPPPVRPAPVAPKPLPSIIVTERAQARNRVRWTEEETETLRSLAEQGYSTFHIARNLRRTMSAIRCRAKAIGCAITGRPKPPAALDVDSIKLLYRLVYERPIPHAPARVRFVIAETARQHGLLATDILSECRSHIIARARQQAMWICARDTTLSLAQIGRHFGRDHTTVISSIRRENARSATNVRGLGGPRR